MTITALSAPRNTDPGLPDPGEVRAYNITQVAAFLGTGRSYVYELIHSGQLPAVALTSTDGAGREKYRVRHNVLAAFLDAHATSGAGGVL